MNFLKVLDELKRDEGLRLTPYKCPAGFWTIGYGCNLEASFTKEMAQCLLELETRHVYTLLLREVQWFVDLNDVRQRAIVNMAYNLGLQGLAKFKKMIAAIKANDFDKAADEILDSQYANQVGARAVRIATMIRIGVDNGS